MKTKGMPSWNEVHCFVVGFCEIIPPWGAKWLWFPQEDLQRINKEYHYYMSGRCVGFLVLLGLAFVMVSFLS